MTRIGAFTLALAVGVAGGVAARPLLWGGPAVLAQGGGPIPGTRVPTEAEKKAATAAIEGQLKAFKADDYAAALKFQSSELKENFPNAESFRQAIRQGYPQFASYKKITFGEARADKTGDRLAVSVILTGQDGVTVQAIYLMIREKGEYKVDSVLGGTKPTTPVRDEV
jgi:hypothetical protein